MSHIPILPVDGGDPKPRSITEYPLQVATRQFNFPYPKIASTDSRRDQARYPSIFTPSSLTANSSSRKYVAKYSCRGGSCTASEMGRVDSCSTGKPFSVMIIPELVGPVYRLWMCCRSFLNPHGTRYQLIRFVVDIMQAKSEMIIGSGHLIRVGDVPQ